MNNGGGVNIPLFTFTFNFSSRLLLPPSTPAFDFNSSSKGKVDLA
jgi:hypothetical protein